MPNTLVRSILNFSNEKGESIPYLTQKRTIFSQKWKIDEKQKVKYSNQKDRLDRTNE